MTVGARLKEERVRLGRSQTEFAALAGAKKGTQISWEKDASSPTAQALVAFAEAGADVLYILTAKREHLRHPDEMMAHHLDEIRRRLLNYDQEIRPNESQRDARDRVISEERAKIQRVLDYDVPAGLVPELVERTKALWELTEDFAKLEVARAEDDAQNKLRRADVRSALLVWLEVQAGTYRPNDSVVDKLVLLETDYGVPVKILVELLQEIFADIASRPSLPERL